MPATSESAESRGFSGSRLPSARFQIPTSSHRRTDAERGNGLGKVERKSTAVNVAVHGRELQNHAANESIGTPVTSVSVGSNPTVTARKPPFIGGFSLPRCTRGNGCVPKSFPAYRRRACWACRLAPPTWGSPNSRLRVTVGIWPTVGVRANAVGAPWPRRLPRASQPCGPVTASAGCVHLLRR